MLYGINTVYTFLPSLTGQILVFLLNPGSSERPVTFAQLKPRLMNLVMNALQVETDPQNTHMLLGGLFLCVQDSAIFEKVEQVTQPPAEASSNLLSSGEFLTFDEAVECLFVCLLIEAPCGFLIFNFFCKYACSCGFFLLFSVGYCEHLEHD